MACCQERRAAKARLKSKLKKELAANTLGPNNTCPIDGSRTILEWQNEGRLRLGYRVCAAEQHILPSTR